MNDFLVDEQTLFHFRCRLERFNSGRGYISQDSFTFASKKTRLTFSLSEVLLVRKHRAAGFVSSGITFVKKDGSKITLSAVHHLEYALTLLDLILSGVDIHQFCEQFSQSASTTCHSTHSLHESELFSRSASEVALSKYSEEPSTTPVLRNGEVVTDNQLKDIVFPHFQPEPFPSKIKVLISATYSVSARQFAEQVFYDKTCWSEFLKTRKFFDIDLSDWNQESSNQPLKRTLHVKAIFTHPLIGTRTINATQNHQLFSCDSKYYLSIEITTSGAPMTDAINLYLSICCSSISASSCSVSVNFGIHFVKSSMFKSIIQKQTTSETLDYYETFLDHCSTFIKHSTNAPAYSSFYSFLSEPNSLSHNARSQESSQTTPLVSEVNSLKDTLNSLISVNFLLVLLLVFVSLSSLRNNSLLFNIVVVFVLLTFFIVMKVFKPKPKVTNEKPRIQEQEVLKPEPKESHVSKPELKALKKELKALQKEEHHSRKKKQKQRKQRNDSEEKVAQIVTEETED